MIKRHLNTRMKIALNGGSIIALAVPSEGGDIQGAIASEAEKVGSTVALDTVQVREVYLSDVTYSDLLPVFTSGVAGQIQTEEQDFAYAYDADQVEKIAEGILEEKGASFCRLLHNLTYENLLAGPINDIMYPIENGTIGVMDTLEINRALDLRPVMEEFVSDYISAVDCQPTYDLVVDDLREKGMLPTHDDDSWIMDAFPVTVAAIAADVVKKSDVTKDDANSALKERDPNLFVVGRDAAHNHEIQVGREIEGGRTYLGLGHFSDYREIVAWARDDENFRQDDLEDEAA